MTVMPRHAPCLLALAIIFACVGCASRPSELGGSMSARDPQRAQQLATEAAELLHTEPTRAESMLREALRLDLFCGAAHNNLGVIHLTRDDLPEAAAEFEAARRLLPGHPDPRCNLALVYERAGRTSDAIAAFQNALDAQPGHLASIQGIASLQVRTGAVDARTVELLDEIALHGESEIWRSWARRQRFARTAGAADDALEQSP
jgi:Tfp pilus assembly protein PilF